MANPDTKRMTPAERASKSKPRKTVGLSKPGKVSWLCSLREIRESLGLSLRDVGSLCGISYAAIHHIEAGTDPMLTTARKLSEFFGKSIEEIWKDLK